MSVTIAILGCGHMGTAILDGILSALGQQHPELLSGQLRPTRLIACVKRAESVSRLEHHFQSYLHTNNKISNGESTPVCQIWQNNNAEAVKLADVILLACQPHQAAGILGEASLREHLSGKLLLSICVGMSATQIQRLIYGVPSHHLADTTAAQDKRCYIVHAMPNIASTVGESATVLSTTAADKDFALRQLPPELEDLAECIFTSIGSVTRVGPALMNTASVTGASTVAFFTTVLEGVVRGATDMGLSESDALHLAAQAMKGTAEMVLRGGEIANTTSSPSEIRDEVMTPNGCTARGVEVLQRARVKDVFAEATRKAVERVFEMDGSKTCQC